MPGAIYRMINRSPVNCGGAVSKNPYKPEQNVNYFDETVEDMTEIKKAEEARIRSVEEARMARNIQVNLLNKFK
ncbi:MAG: hypothetical protein ACE5IR_02500 [bacterium]